MKYICSTHAVQFKYKYFKISSNMAKDNFLKTFLQLISITVIPGFSGIHNTLLIYEAQGVILTEV